MNKIIFVLWGFEAFGGMERHVCELALALSSSGKSVTIVSEMPVASSNFYARRLRANGIAVLAPPFALRIANAVVLAARRPSAQRLIHGGGLLSRRLRRQLAKLTDAERGDVVHVHGCRLGQSWVIDWARERGLATVYTEHVAIDESGGPLTAQGSRSVGAAGVIACVSDQSRLSLASHFPKGQAIAVTSHIVNDTGCGSAAPPGDILALTCVARLEPRKGVDTLLRALALALKETPNLSLTICGDGPLRKMLRRLADELGIASALTFAGSVAPDQIAGHLMAADAVVIPSRSEGLPLALLEAMACGKAIVATRAGGIPELIEDGENGLLVPADDSQALADAIAIIAQNSILRTRLGDAARASFEQGRHAPQRVVEDMLHLYDMAGARC